MSESPGQHPFSEVTVLLQRWGEGDTGASDLLAPLVYDELRRMARSYLYRERSSHTLQPTALVHEAYMRLAGDSQLRPRCRTHFFGIASTAMRCILVDHARANGAAKRGGEMKFQGLENLDVGCDTGLAQFLTVHEAIEALSRMDERKARLIELKYFGGLTTEEMADTLGISSATVERDLKVAHAWLEQRLQ
jgi:RNA polymerase sigma-70 factor (ECF subfamily)